MTSYKQRIEEILYKFSNYWRDDFPSDLGREQLDHDEATTQLLALMDEFGEEVIGQDTPRKIDYFDKVEQANVYLNEEIGSIRETGNILRTEARNLKKELLK